MSAVIEHKVQPEATALIQVIERAASNPSIDVEKMERLLAMQERVLAKQTESEFNEALTAAQAEMSTISADATNPQTRSKYATYAKLDRVLRPIYTRHGFSISYDTDDSPKPDHVRVLAYVSRGGYTRTYKVDMPADGKGAKGGDVMTKTHAAGSAMSYGMRYLLKAIFNVAVGEEDDDGNSASSPPITAEQAKNLQSLAKEVGADIGRFLKYMGVESIEDLPRDKYETALRALEKKRSKK
ncbi:MAG TPA: ERF family protein [Steroidobacter sp.]